MEAFQKAVALKPDYYQAYTNLAHVDKAIPEDPRFNALLSMVADNPSPDTQRDGCFALGKMYEDINAYDTAFHYYNLANDVQTKMNKTVFDPERHKETVSQAIDAYDPAFFSARADFGIQDDLPVFIVGMPRSGTTLVEQILSSHPDMHGAGELPHINALSGRIIRRAGGKNPLLAAACLDKTGSEAAAREYIDLLGKNKTESFTRIIDKMPFNYQYLPLIVLMFPKAKIIHCVRNPADTCLSAYFQNFTEEMAFTNDLAHLAEYFNQYGRLMDHWKKVLPVPVCDIHYEDLVTDQEKWSRRLTGFCGVDWDEKCLEFHRHRRTVSTASAWQVRQKIYKDSAGKWRHYQAHLGPLLRGLSM